jgi:outer membrane protein assembly factor BamD
MSRFSLRLLPSALVLSVAVLCAATATAQETTTPAQDTAVPAAQAPATGTLSNTPSKKKVRLTKQEKKDNKVVATKDTKKALKKAKKDNPLAGVDVNLPDKQLFDKAMLAMQRNHFDIARLDLQTLLNTYPDSQFQMRAKLAIGDSWYKEGGTAALTQAEQEYKDFITFFPNQPEAAEAQMKVANIYFREMDRPDRDYERATRAQEEYRNMIQQFPESTLVPEAKQKLREVQEVLATRESNIAQFYGSHQNWAAAIARYQTVADTYPLYSRMDDTLLGLGDAYAAQAKLVATMRLPEGPKGRLEKIYNDQAAAMYDRLLTVYPAAAHVEDAKDRLTALGYPIPKPTAEQLAASETLENSRTPYTLKRRAKLLVMHSPDTVSTAQAGEPTMADPPPTDAPKVIHEDIADVRGVMDPANANTAGPLPGGTGSDALASAAPAPDAGSDAAVAAPAPAAAPLALSDVPTNNSAPTSGTSVTSVPVAPASGRSGDSIGAEVVPSGSVPATGSTDYPGSNGPSHNNDLVKPVGGTADAALPPVEAPADSPAAINDIKPGSQAAVPAANPNAKPVKAPYNAKDESSNKHKKKKGLDKLNPF